MFPASAGTPERRGLKQLMSEQKKTYINAPFPPSTAKKVKALAKKSARSIGRQVVWIVERFLEER